MQIKRSILAIICSILTLVIVFGWVCYKKYDRQRKEELAFSKLMEDFDRAIEREYKNLLQEYESIVETINDNSYSYGFRYRYVVKLNKLLDCRQYDYIGTEYSTVANCIDEQPRKKKEDLKILKQKAQLKAFEN
ncbi:hypothetical protein DW785_23025 [Bacteroides xylanisolvens]|uniref:hypothetical protein n=1 Tax=Bacteroides xylanisolvens TaxID=371601 RepID=UPI000E4D7004|nr:hypothetical protein [Bacteroides xylanisolvens]RHD60165.1 hypothetical protein DW785_23025 [Bacteroides xylanisolvens]